MKDARSWQRLPWSILSGCNQLSSTGSVLCGREFNHYVASLNLNQTLREWHSLAVVAVCNLRRIPLASDRPTMADQGKPAATSRFWFLASIDASLVKTGKDEAREGQRRTTSSTAGRRERPTADLPTDSRQSRFEMRLGRFKKTHKDNNASNTLHGNAPRAAGNSAAALVAGEAGSPPIRQREGVTGHRRAGTQPSAISVATRDSSTPKHATDESGSLAPAVLTSPKGPGSNLGDAAGPHHLRRRTSGDLRTHSLVPMSRKDSGVDLLDYPAVAPLAARVSVAHAHTKPLGFKLSNLFFSTPALSETALAASARKDSPMPRSLMDESEWLKPLEVTPISLPPIRGAPGELVFADEPSMTKMFMTGPDETDSEPLFDPTAFIQAFSRGTKVLTKRQQRAVFDQSHDKLAETHRSLRDMVLISNMMCTYVAKTMQDEDGCPPPTFVPHETLIVKRKSEALAEKGMRIIPKRPIIPSSAKKPDVAASIQTDYWDIVSKLEPGLAAVQATVQAPTQKQELPAAGPSPVLPAAPEPPLSTAEPEPAFGQPRKSIEELFQTGTDSESDDGATLVIPESSSERSAEIASIGEDVKSSSQEASKEDQQDSEISTFTGLDFSLQSTPSSKRKGHYFNFKDVEWLGAFLEPQAVSNTEVFEIRKLEEEEVEQPRQRSLRRVGRISATDFEKVKRSRPGQPW